jgi:hypothetical protein
VLALSPEQGTLAFSRRVHAMVCLRDASIAWTRRLNGQGFSLAHAVGGEPAASGTRDHFGSPRALTRRAVMCGSRFCAKSRPKEWPSRGL